jgi:hypothetical protein
MGSRCAAGFDRYCPCVEAANRVTIETVGIGVSADVFGCGCVRVAAAVLGAQLRLARRAVAAPATAQTRLGTRS